MECEWWIVISVGWVVVALVVVVGVGIGEWMGGYWGGLVVVEVMGCGIADSGG